MNKPSRIMGLDIARLLTIIGMIIVHMASLPWGTKVVLSGLPSSLFAVIAGATMMIIGRDYSSATFLRLITHGTSIILIGLALLLVGWEIRVVLVIMGLVMMLVSRMPALETWWRVDFFITAAIVATIRYAPMTLPQICSLLAWIAYFIGGMLFYDVYLRSCLRGTSTSENNTNAQLSWVITTVGAVITAVDIYFRFDSETTGWLRFTRYTGVFGEIILSVAVTAIILHLCLLVGDYFPAVICPFAAMGTMSLTIYILHVPAAFYWQQNMALHSALSTAGFIVFFLVSTSLWKKFVGQDPAEKLVATTTKAIVPFEREK